MTIPGTPQEQTPLHLAISEQLRQQIVSGTYAPGEQLPSEYQLIERFRVSRITVRRAIANLVNQGLVVARQGKGVFVKEQRKVIYRLSEPFVFFSEEMARQGVHTAVRNLVFKSVTPPVEMQQTLQLGNRTRHVYFQKKLILLDDTPVAVDCVYILPRLGKTFAGALKHQMTFPTLEQHGIGIVRIEALLEATHADPELSEHLDVSLGYPLMSYRYTTYTSGDKPVLAGELLSRGDRLCYSVALTRPIQPN